MLVCDYEYLSSGMIVVGRVLPILLLLGLLGRRLLVHRLYPCCMGCHLCLRLRVRMHSAIHLWHGRSAVLGRVHMLGMHWLWLLLLLLLCNLLRGLLLLCVLLSLVPVRVGEIERRRTH